MGGRKAFAEEPKLTLTPEPIRYAFVEGDLTRFKAFNWMREGYVGGVKQFSMNYENDKEGIASEGEGHAIVDENDIDGVITVKKKDLGFVKVDYSSFRKYYDRTGGTYMPFGRFRTITTDRDLVMNMGNFEVEAGLTIPEWPELTFAYERETKWGTKSSLTWASVRESGVTRKTSPTWKEIDEVVHNFILKAHKDLWGFSVKGEQRWELDGASTRRQERQFSDTLAAVDSKIRTQEQDPSADLSSTTVELERWFFNDKAFFSTGYRLGNVSAKEVENIFETDNTGRAQSYANAEQVRNALGYTYLQTHTFVTSFMVDPWKWLNSIAHFKTEIFREKGSSTYPKDTTPLNPDGVINNTAIAGTANKVLRVGEGLSVRFKGIPKTALYADVELEQIKDLLIEDSNSIRGQSAQSLGDVFSRITATYIRRGVGKVGCRVTPWRFMDVTSEVRHWQNNNDYDDRMETDGTASQAKSAFVDWQNISTNEASARMTLRPVRWLQPSFRYQLRTDQYLSGFQTQGTDSKTNMTSHVYTFDLAFQPTPELLSTLTYSKQTAVTATGARFAAPDNGQTQAFYAGVSSWLLSSGYTLNPKTVLTNSIVLSEANNFRDVSAITLPLGADYTKVDVTTGIRFTPSQDMTIEPKYTFSQYRPNEEFEFDGGYTAHVIWLDFTLRWPFIEPALKPLAKAVGDTLSKVGTAAQEYL